MSYALHGQLFRYSRSSLLSPVWTSFPRDVVPVLRTLTVPAPADLAIPRRTIVVCLYTKCKGLLQK